MHVEPEFEDSWAFLTQFEFFGAEYKEEWKAVRNYEGFYEVSNLGRVKSISRLTKFGNQSKFVVGRDLVIKRRTGKYPFVILSKANTQRSCMVHRLVAEAFVDNPLNLPCVNHVLGDKDDNRFFMLEWCSYSNNILHSFDMGLHRQRKLTASDVLAIRSSNESDIDLGKRYGVQQGNIWNIRQRKSWKHI